ncbi:MAG: DUF2303 family protein [Aquincola sp.]|nr:DUF2303 family protein [Aquincola sp.]
MENNSKEQGALAEVLVREARKPVTLDTALPKVDDRKVTYAIPPGYTTHVVDTENLLDNPRRKRGTAQLQDMPSFLAFVERHKSNDTVAWAGFDIDQSKLSIQAVMDDHGTKEAGWRGFRAVYAPSLSVEWERWKAMNEKPMSQLDFALFIERNQDDITGGDGFPSSLDMLKMATEFEASADMRLKTHTRLQSGGIKLEYVDQEKDETIQRMTVFEKFAIGVPVFRNATAWKIEARLRYRVREGKVTFSYELLRADKTVEQAGNELIEQARVGLGTVPLLTGTFAQANS